MGQEKVFSPFKVGGGLKKFNDVEDVDMKASLEDDSDNLGNDSNQEIALTPPGP